MEINATTLRSLDPSKAYYLSNTTGKIKESGFWQWIKCVLDIGDARAKSAALAAKVKEALLADGEIKTEATLDAEIGQLDTSRSLSGAELARIANRFRASHAEAVGRADARRTAEDIAEHEAEAWIANKSIHPDPVSVGYVKKLAVYAASSVIANAAQYPAPELLARKIRSKMGLLNTMLGCLGEMTRKSDLDYPRASSVARKDGSAYDLAGPCLKLDELHFRLCLANMCDQDGDIRLNVYQNAYSFPEHDLAIKSRQRKALPNPLEDAARPGAVAAIPNAARKKYNNYTVAAGQGETTGGTQKLPRRIEEVTTQLLDDVRNIYGEGAVPQDARFFDCVPGTHFADIVRPLANAANDAHRVLKPAEVKDALRDRCRLGAAALFATRAAKTFAATHNLDDIDVSFGTTLLKRNTAIRDELLACTKPNEAEEVMARHGAEIRELAGIIAAVTAEKNRLVDRAAAKLAQATGMTVDEVKAKTDFFRLTDKAHDVEVKLIAGSYPGCREPGFSIASAFDAGLDAFVNIRITLLKKIDDEEGLSGSVKANWRDPRSRQVRQDRRPTRRADSRAARDDSRRRHATGRLRQGLQRTGRQPRRRNRQRPRRRDVERHGAGRAQRGVRDDPQRGRGQDAGLHGQGQRRARAPARHPRTRVRAVRESRLRLQPGENPLLLPRPRGMIFNPSSPETYGPAEHLSCAIQQDRQRRLQRRLPSPASKRASEPFRKIRTRWPGTDPTRSILACDILIEKGKRDKNHADA